MRKFASPLFAGLTDAELRELQELTLVREKSFARGETVLHCGNIAREVCVVLSGRVQIESIDLGGGRSILSSVGAGQVFAETYALCGEPLMVDAVAAEPSAILFLRAAALDAAYTAHSWQQKLLRNMLSASMHKNLILSSRIFCTAPKTIRQRLLTYFSMQAARAGSSEFDIPYDRQQLADYLNLDRSALSKELGKMRDDGMLEFYKNHFKLKPAVSDPRGQTFFSVQAASSR